MKRKGILLVIACPPAGMEDEFNAWYDTEHLPERVALPGFETGLRFMAASGARTYLALYDLTGPEALHTPDYAAVAGDRSSPWTKRITSRARVYRAAGEQISPGDALSRHCARLLLIRLRALKDDAAPTIVKGLNDNFAHRTNVFQTRVFNYPREDGAGTDFICLVEARAPIDEAFDAALFGPHASAIDMVESFVPR